MTKKKKIICYLALFIVIFSLLIANTTIYYQHIDQKLATFDLDNDGIFSLGEQTPDQQRYSDIAISTYRGIFPIVEVFRSLILTGLLLVVLETYGFFRKRLKNKKS